MLIFMSHAAGVCRGGECCDNQDGRQQPRDGDGPELSALRVGRPQGHLRQHAQGDGVHARPGDASRH